jgi:cation transporter-like permease
VNLRSNFPAQVVVVLVCALLLLAYPLTVFAPGEIRAAVAAGAALSTVNVMLGYMAIRYSFDRSHTTFLKAVLGGMGLRLLFMLGAFIALIAGFGMQPVALTVSLLGFYTVFMVLEIVYIQRRMTVRNRNE